LPLKEKPSCTAILQTLIYVAVQLSSNKKEGTFFNAPSFQNPVE